MVVGSFTVAGVMVGVGTASADSPNPTSGTGTAVVNADGTITVTVSGTWDWERGNWCFNDRWAAGWAIDWNDPTQPGHVVDTLNGVTYDVGVATANARNAFDNTVYFYNTASRCGTRPAGSDRDVGTWGPLSHTYPAGTTNIAACAVMYDIHEDKGGPKLEDLIAGGNKHNSDNSIEKNSAPVNTCFPITVQQNPTLTLNKVVLNNNGGVGTLADFVLSATPQGGGAAIVNGADPNADPNVGVSGTGTAGTTYVLAETARAGYTASAWSCTGGAAVVGNTITLQTNQKVNCVITNDDTPVDLTLTKNDGGVNATAGGASFPYTLTIDNVGTRNIDAGDTVTVTDVLPAGFEYVSSTGTCSVAGAAATGQTVTCTVPATDLDVADPPVVITLTVRVLAGTAAGNYTNKAYVATEDDPPCVGAACPPPCPPVNNNVDCEDTPVGPPPSPPTTPSISIVKKVNGFDANTTPGLIVPTGSTLVFSYEVTNTGNAALSNVTVADDKGLVVTCPATTLAIGASMTCSASAPAPAFGQYTNVGTATGTPPSGTPVTASDTANAFIALPAIDITKFVNGADANTPPGLSIVSGSAVTWTYRVANAGNVDLVNVRVTDDKGVTVDCGGSSTIALLRVGEQKTCTATGTAITGAYTNVGTATGTPNPPLLPGQTPLATGAVTDSDAATYTGTPAVAPEVLPPAIPEGELPATGSGNTLIALVALALVALGALLATPAWRRRRSA